MRIEISFGALAEPLADQLRQQGLLIGREKCSRFQSDMDASARLSVRGLLSDSEATKVRRRLLKAILSEVEIQPKKLSGTAQETPTSEAAIK